MSYTSEEFPNTAYYRSDLREILRRLKKLDPIVDGLVEWKETHEKEYEELKELYDQIISGDFPESVEKAFYDWMQKNAFELVGSMVKNVFFGLTDSGYFVAYIPESWEDITFNTTGWDIEVALQPNYGHLVLSY